MGYRGPSLARVYDLSDSADRLCRGLAEEGGRRMTLDVREFTPVGLDPFREGYVPGHLLESIRQKVLVVIPVPGGGTIYRSGTETNVVYAIYVEHGTGLWGPARSYYEIRPKNPDGWLRFHDPHGNVVFAKRVLHPGSPGAHMFARGSAKTEAEMHSWLRERVRRWEIEQVAEIDVRARVKDMVS